MSQIAHVLSPTQRQLTSLARSLLCAPDVLLIHELGELTAKYSMVIGEVLQNYVAGMAITRLGGKPQPSKKERSQKMQGVARRKS